MPATRDMKLQHDESAIHEELNLAWAGQLLTCIGVYPLFNCIVYAYWVKDGHIHAAPKDARASSLACVFACM